MNSLAMHRPGETQQYMQSWVLSLALHGLAVGLSILIVSDLQVAPQPEPFKWDVSVIETPQKPTQAEPPVPPPAPPTTARPPARPTPVEPKPVVKTVQTVQPVQRVVRQEVRETKPIVETVMQPTELRTEPIPETISRTAEPIQPLQQTLPLQPVATAVTEAPPVERETARPVTQEVLEETTPTASEPSVVSQRIVEAPQDEAVTLDVKESTSQVTHSPVTEPFVVSRSVVETAHGETIQERSVVKEAMTKAAEATVQPTDAAEPTVIQQASIRQRPARAVQPRPDFGWLAQSLWSSVEQLKRYPHLARMNRWEGKVVLRAVIRDDGQVIDVEVTESSGHSVLDNAALEVIKKASPLKLKHPLGQPQVVVQVPISYKLQ